jgi:hypothetical protein
LADSAIRRARLLRYTPPPPLQRRVFLGAKAREALSDARRITTRYGMPFWDAVFLAAMRRGHVPAELLDATDLSAQHRDDVVIVYRRGIAAGGITKAASARGNPAVCAIASRVSYAGRRDAHFPMLDLRCKRSASNCETALDVARRLLPGGGWLLDSGRSYHIVGTSPVSAVALGRFLVNALFYAPIVDRHYVAHHLRRGWCSLRISQGGRADATPTVTSVF